MNIYLFLLLLHVCNFVNVYDINNYNKTVQNVYTNEVENIFFVLFRVILVIPPDLQVVKKVLFSEISLVDYRNYIG